MSEERAMEAGGMWNMCVEAASHNLIWENLQIDVQHYRVSPVYPALGDGGAVVFGLEESTGWEPGGGEGRCGRPGGEPNTHEALDLAPLHHL